MHIRQNDSILSSNVPVTYVILEHIKNPKSVIWGGICSTGKTTLTFVDQGMKINKEAYRCDIFEPSFFLRLTNISTKQIGRFSNTQFQHIGQKRFKIGAKLIFQISSRFWNGSHILRIRWNTVFGLFWKPEFVQNPIKMWRHKSCRC